MTSGSRVQWLHPCALLVQPVSVYKGVDSAQFTNRGHWGLWWTIQCVPRGMIVRGWLPKKETYPRRTATPRQEGGSLRHPWGSQQIFSFVNSAHRVSNSENVAKCQGHMTILCARGMWHFFQCQGHEHLFKIMRLSHWCLTPSSQVWLALFYCHNPTPNQSWGTVCRLLMIYCVLTHHLL